jgi:oligo-alginate lyase
MATNNFHAMYLLACCAVVLGSVPKLAIAQSTAATPAVATPAAPLFEAEMARAIRFVDEMIKAGVNVPMPRDPGGGYTHEQHKRNYRAIAEAGWLFRLTGDQKYANFIRDTLLAYAEIYPRLGPHPARSNQQYGRLFWQNLNDAVWLVNAIQGYEDVRAALNEAQRARIDSLFRAHAQFMSVESVRTFDRIHNHATWSTAGVGMTGYVLGDRDMVQRALLGSRKDGKAGFLRQMDELFSPDGYYAEGPYYQRYALWPFMVFANAIDRNDPDVRIFGRRDGLLLKALNTAIQLTYNGRFMSFNDAMKDKSLNTEELYQGVAIAYARTNDPQLLSIAQYQQRVAFSPEGRKVAQALARGLAKPFRYISALFSDGADGRGGAIAVFRNGEASRGQALVVKNSSQGMGHGHFDKLSWQFYDNGHEVVTDYGAARFLNIVAKDGGKYLPENESWAKQTIAHNTLVVDERSHFGFDEAVGEANPARQLHFSASPEFSVSIGESATAYPGVTMSRAMALVAIEGLERPVVVDLLRVRSGGRHRYDLPLHYDGHIIRVGPALTSHVSARPVLGASYGYEHIWVDAAATPTPSNAFLTWQLGDRFYTWRWAPVAGSQMILAESGANDPSFNLRRAPMVIQRASDQGDTLFASVLESHGRYDAAAEQTSASDSQIRSITAQSIGMTDVMIIEALNGARIAVAVAHDGDQSKTHEVTIAGERIAWTGPAGRIALQASPKRTSP